MTEGKWESKTSFAATFEKACNSLVGTYLTANCHMMVSDSVSLISCFGSQAIITRSLFFKSFPNSQKPLFNGSNIKGAMTTPII